MKTAELLTFEQFEQLPESPGKQELLDGELIEVPPAKRTHRKISRRVLRLLQAAPVDQESVWFETGYRFPDGSWLQPDVSVSWPDQKVEDDYFIGAPMLAIEIGSRGNTAEQLDRKIGRYFGCSNLCGMSDLPIFAVCPTCHSAEGASEVWVIQEKTASMTVYRLDEAGEISSRRITGTYEFRRPEMTLRISVPELLQGVTR